MAVSGVGSMLKALGLDPDELKGNVEGFMLFMKAESEKINRNQFRIETKLDQILANQAHASAPSGSTPILENGVDTGVFVTDEKFPQAMIDDVNRGS